MSKLVLCLGQETFTLPITHLSKNEEGKWRYWNYSINAQDDETVRLIRHLGYYRFEPIPWREAEISITEEDTKGFLGRDKTITEHYFYISCYKDRIHPRSIYLED